MLFLQNKRRLRRLWKLKEIKNQNFNTFLKNLTAHNNRNDENDLWKATKYLKKPTKRNVPFKDLNVSWYKSDRSKACAFSKYLESSFQPFSFNNDDSNITSYLDIPCQMDFPITHIRPK